MPAAVSDETAGARTFVRRSHAVEREAHVATVAGEDGFLLNLSGGHAPWFIRCVLVLEDESGSTVPFTPGNSRWGPEFTRLARIMPDEDLTPGGWYTATLHLHYSHDPESDRNYHEPRASPAYGGTGQGAWLRSHYPLPRGEFRRPSA